MADKNKIEFGVGDTVKHKVSELKMLVVGRAPYNPEHIRCSCYNDKAGRCEYGIFEPVELIIVEKAKKVE